MKMHSSCEMEEDFVETRLCKLCVTLRSRILRGVYVVRRFVTPMRASFVHSLETRPPASSRPDLTALRPLAPRRMQIMAYYLLTVLEQDDGVEVQRLVKDLVRSRVSGLFFFAERVGSGAAVLAAVCFVMHHMWLNHPPSPLRTFTSVLHVLGDPPRPPSLPHPWQRKKVLESPEIKGALRVVRAWHAGDYVTFFRALRSQGVMHRCLLSQYVKSMRDTAIKVGFG